MMRLLAYTSPARGHLYPIVPILLELQLRGHEVGLRTLASQVAMVCELGIDTEPISRGVEEVELDDYRGRSAPAKGRLAIATFAARARHEAPDLREAIDRHDPEVLLIDINCWGAATVAEASGRPWAMYSPYLLPLHSRDTPPFGLGLRPLGGPLGAARDMLVRRAVDLMFDRTTMPTVNSLRRRNGLPALARFADLLGRAPLLLSLTAEGFEYPRSDWPANVQLVGPVNWSPPLPPPEWLSEIADPLVLVTCSTERQRDKRLLDVALEALPGEGISVLGTSAAHDSGAFDPPPGSKVVRFISHEAIVERAVCVVCHGGLGITQKALSAGVPVVVVPFGRDQAETARRVEHAEAGVCLSPRRLTPARLLNAVRGAIERRPGAQRVSRVFAAAGGVVAAAETIETLGGTRSGVFMGDKIRPSSAGAPE